MKVRTTHSTPPSLPTRLAFALACALGGSASANPSGSTVVSGQASVAAVGKTLTVTSTPGTVIHWRGFSIGPDELTRFVQQNAKSSVLNRVVGQDPSLLLGRLESNGRVFLVNPNGIVFGAGARIDVGGLVASTLDLSDADFLGGRLRFGGAPGAGPLRQLGTIQTASGGQVVLIAPRVENSGVITTPQGEVILAAGGRVQLADSADPDLRVAIEAPAGEVLNLGRLIAESGRIGIHAGLVGNNGVISAASHAEIGAGGEVYLKAGGGIALDPASRIEAGGAGGGGITIDGGDGAVRIAGRLDAAGRTGRGGRVHLLGRAIALAHAAVDASGASGGGEVLVGGDFQGSGALRRARTTAVDAASELRADARDDGRGGKVIVWSDEQTAFAGSISARGGAGGGNGGRVEVSGKQALGFSGRVDTRAARGATGTLLLDPSDITISTAADSAVSAGPDYTGTAASSNLNVTTLQTALASNNVIVDTTSAFAGTGNISVGNAVTWASAHSLELRAHNDITVAAGATVNATGTGALRLIANQDAVGGGNVSINAALTARSGGMSISGVDVSGSAAGTLTTTGLANQNAGTVSIAATGVVNLAGAIVASGGIAGAATAGRSGGTVTIGGSAITTAAISALGSAGNGVNQAGGDAGSISLTASAALATGALTASTGSATGTGVGGTAAAIELQGSTIGTTTLTTTGGANGAGGAITATATAGSLTTGSIIASGGIGNAASAGGRAGVVSLVSGGAVTTASVLAIGGAGGAGAGAAGGDGATVVVSGIGTISAGALTAEGGAAGGTAAAGGGSGSIVVTNNSTIGGTVTTGALTARPGAATGTVLTGGAPGGVSVSNSAATLLQTGTILTSGRANGAGGNVTLLSAGDATVTGVITTSGGTLTAGTAAAGRNAGNVTVRAANRTLTAAAITASGGAAIVTGNTGGSAGAVLLTGTDGTAATAGTLATAAIAASSGGSLGTTAGGTAGSVTLEGTTVSAAALTTTGGANAAGGAIAATAATGLLNVTGAINANGGAANISSAGRNAGSVTLSGVNVTTLGITASGTNGNGSGFAGGNGATVSVTGTGGAVAVGAISAAAGNGVAGNAAGGDAGSITLDAGGVMPSIALTGSLTATGGTRTGTGTAGAGAQIWLKDPALIGVGALTLAAAGGSPGVGAGGDVRFDGSIDSSGAARSLTVNTNGATIFNGAIGAGSALSSLTTDATGTTQLNGGTVTTTAAQAFGDAVALGGTTTLEAGAGAITFSNTVNGASGLTANSGAVTTFSGAVGAVTPLASLTTNAGGSTRIGGGSINTSGDQTYNDAVNYAAGTVLAATAGTVVSGGAFTASAPAGALTLAVDPTRDIALVNPANDFATVTVSSARNVELRDANAIVIGASTLSGTLAVTAGGAITQAGAWAVGGTASLSTGAAAVTLNNAGNDFMASVSVTNTGGNVAITDANDLQLGAISMAAAAHTLTVASNGAITQAGASTITTGTSAVSFNSGAGGSPITLGNDNDFRGAVSLTSAGAGDVAIKDANALTFGAGAVARHLQAKSAGAMAFNGVLSVAGHLQADSGGNAVTQGAAAPLTVTGTTLLSAGAAGNITLNHAGNNFGGEVRVVSGNAVTLRDANALAFGNGGTSTISGNLTVTSAGAITQTEPLNVAGRATFAPGAANSVTLLDAGNDFGGIAFTNGTTATMRDANGVVFGTTSVATLDINAGGTVTQDGAVTATTLTADLTGAASALDFHTSSNGVTNLAVSGGKGITAPGGFRLTNGAGGISGRGIVATSNAPIHVITNGLFQNAGTSAFVAGSGDITVISSQLSIDSTAAGGVFQTSGTLLMRPATAAADMSFGGALVAYNLIPVEVARVVSGVTGAVTFGEQGFSTGVLTVAGALGFGNITANLNAGSITDGGTVRTVTARNLNMKAATGTIGTAVANGAIDVAVTNLTLSTANQNASVTSTSGYNLGFGAIESNVGVGTLRTNVSSGGSITQTTKVVAGTFTALLAGGSGAVHLDAVDNAISNIGSVTALQGFHLTNGNNPTTVTANILANGPVSISTGTGAFSQNNIDISAGGGPITITADAIGIVANTGSNAMQTTGTLTLKPFSAGTNMSLAGTSAFDLTAAAVADIVGGVGPAGAIVIGDAAASTGAMTIGGAVNFGVRTVTLNAGSFTDGNSASRISARDLNLNARTGAIGAAGGNNAIDVTTTNLTFNTDNQDAFINASGAVNLGGGTSTTGNGNIDLSAGGALTQSPGGAIASSGGTVLAAGTANDITLNAANDFGTVVVANGRNVTLNDTNALDLGASTISGNLQATTAGALTQSGAIVANGAGKAATFSAGNGNDITLTGANDFTSVAVGSARNATLHDSNALALGASTVTGAFVATAGGSVTLNGVINAGGAGNAIVLAAAGNFVNNAGAAALVPGSGRWLVYSSDPAADTRGGLLYDFKQYDATYGATPVLGTGDGMLHSLAPTLAVSLGGAVDKVYSGTTAATLAAANYALSGTIDADTATLNNPAMGTYATRNVGSGIDVSVAGVAVASSTNAGRPVYGYRPASSTVSANIGNITAAPLTVTAQTDIRAYDSTTASAVAPAVAGALYDPVGTAAIQAFDTKNVGGGKTLTAAGLMVNDGNGGGNYAINYVTINSGAITPAGLTVTGVAANNKVYDATATATLATGGAGLGGVFAGDTVTLDTGASSGTFADKNVGIGKPVTASGFTISGADATNYTLVQPAGLSGDIARATLAISGMTASNKVYDGTTAATLVTAGGSVAPLGTDTVALDVAGASAAFADKNVGAAKPVTVSGLTISGSDAANYVLVQPVGLAADIGARAITITAGSNAPGSRPYGAATNPAVGYAVGGSGMAGSEDAQTLFGFGIGSAAGPTTPVGVYSTGTEPYRISGLAPGTFGNYRIVAVGDGILTVSPALAGPFVDPPPASLFQGLSRSLFGALERDLPTQFGTAACAAPLIRSMPSLDGSRAGRAWSRCVASGTRP